MFITVACGAVSGFHATQSPMIALWVSTAYLLKKGKYRFGSAITALPATFMTAVSTTYILLAKEGLQLGRTVSYAAGIAAAAALFCIYLVFLLRRKANRGQTAALY